MNLVNYAQGLLYMYKAWKRAMNQLEFNNVSKLAIENFEEAFEHMSNANEISLNIAELYMGNVLLSLPLILILCRNALQR